MPLRVSAILLAAGSSRRMGQLKQLLPLGDKPIIRYCLDSLIAAGIEDLVVVLGPRGNEILDTVKDIPVKIVFNKNPKSEMAESVRIGFRTIAESSSGVLVSLSDHPLVKADTLKKLVHCHLETPDRIVIPLYKGQRGHPSLFPKIIIEEVFAGFNLRDIIHKDPNRIRFLDVEDEGVILDMDTREDYKKILDKVKW
jgi:CTP:molybdopterin cytidylyltransferase MocA